MAARVLAAISTFGPISLTDKYYVFLLFLLTLAFYFMIAGVHGWVNLQLG
jgi:hypothetical protein